MSIYHNHNADVYSRLKSDLCMNEYYNCMVVRLCMHIKITLYVRYINLSLSFHGDGHCPIFTQYASNRFIYICKYINRIIDTIDIFVQSHHKIHY